MDTISLAQDAVKKSIARGCDEAEVFIKTAKRLSVMARNRSVEALESANEFGMSLRVIKAQRLGFSFTTEPHMLDDMVSDAIRGAESTAIDENFGVPEQRGVTEDVLIFDEKIRDTGEEDVMRYALLLEKFALEFDKRIKKVRKAELSLATESTTIFNSKGVNVSYEDTHISASVTALADDGKDAQTGWDLDVSRRLDSIDLVSIAQRASKNALALLGSRRITSIKVPVILEPPVAVDFLHILSMSISADAVHKKRSMLAGKLGEEIMSPVITIFDDALIPWRIGTRPVDDEGVPTSKKTIVSRGILKGFIHNTYTAKKDRVVSTGNAYRSSFKSLPGINITNFYIEPAKDNNRDRIIKSLSKALLVLEAMGVHTANPVSGDFSIGISGLWIEGGEIAFPVKEAVMSGNIIDLFKKVESVGNDLKFYGKFGSPSLLIADMDISA
jgi:PmbA protein